jgi:hypothetical protein
MNAKIGRDISNCRDANIRRDINISVNTRIRMDVNNSKTPATAEKLKAVWI